MMSNYKPAHIPQLDGLRGVAILLVITYHFLGPLKIFSFGWSGVDLFFVLSGFLITGKLLASVNHPSYFINFYWNRVLRIFPLYYSVLLIFYASILLFVKQEHLSNISFYKEHWTSFFLFTQNWTFLFHGFPKDKYLLHFWSLALEEQFYLIWPLIIYLFANKKLILKIMLLVPLISLLLRCLFFFSDLCPYNQYFNLNSFCRMDSFALGAAVSFFQYAKIKVKPAVINILIIVSFVSLIASIFVFQSASFYINPLLHTIGFSLFAILYASILYKILQPEETLVTEIFKSTILKFFGKISYGLYIFHWLVLIVLYQRVYDWGMLHLINNNYAMGFVSTLICITLSIFLSVISFYYFESYFLSLKKKTDEGE